ncbi:hypothetical protein AMTRI_Chr08g164880 [Amborella trichopoda]
MTFGVARVKGGKVQVSRVAMAGKVQLPIGSTCVQSDLVKKKDSGGSISNSKVAAIWMPNINGNMKSSRANRSFPIMDDRGRKKADCNLLNIKKGSLERILKWESVLIRVVL